MKHYINITVGLLLFITACNSEKKEVENNEAKTMEALLHFSETEDPNFCDSNLIIGSDCGFGNVYLTQKGEAIYNSFCMGQDSASYSIGTYVVADSSIVCTFSNDYCYYSCDGCMEEMDTLPKNPNSGKLHTTTQWTLKLEKLNCPTYEYCIRNTPEEQAEINKEVVEMKKGGTDMVVRMGYCFARVNVNGLKEYKDDLSKIKAFESYIKP